MKKMNRMNAGMNHLIMARYIKVRFIFWSGNTSYQYSEGEVEVFNEYHYIRSALKGTETKLYPNDSDCLMKSKITKGLVDEIDELFESKIGLQGPSERYGIDSVLFEIKRYVSDELSDIETMIDIFYRNRPLKKFEEEVKDDLYYMYVSDKTDVRLADVLASFKVVRNELLDNLEIINGIYEEFLGILND